MNKESLIELAALVTVRNHLATLMDTQWRTIKNSAKYDFRQLTSLINELDNKFLDAMSGNKTNDKQLDLDFTGKTTQKKRGVIKRVSDE